VRLELFAKCGGKEYANDWDLWVYPNSQEEAPTNDAVVTDSRRDAVTAFFAGKTVLLDSLAVHLASALGKPAWLI